VRHYPHRSDDDRAKALAALVANGGNVEKTAREVGIPASTLRVWRSGGRGAPPAPGVAENKATLAELWDGAVRSSLGLMARALDHAKETEDDGTLVPLLPDLNRIAGTGTDKALALRGEPTEYHRHEVVLDLRTFGK